ncbi:hypothetical protein FBU30_000058 [Linnemannia zychae]|nr:hypothetical protein FBU30_000058 [Linnemannia zychae]
MSSSFPQTKLTPSKLSLSTFSKRSKNTVYEQHVLANFQHAVQKKGQFPTITKGLAAAHLGATLMLSPLIYRTAEYEESGSDNQQTVNTKPVSLTPSKSNSVRKLSRLFKGNSTNKEGISTSLPPQSLKSQSSAYAPTESKQQITATTVDPDAASVVLNLSSPTLDVDPGATPLPKGLPSLALSVWIFFQLI